MSVNGVSSGSPPILDHGPPPESPPSTAQLNPSSSPILEDGVDGEPSTASSAEPLNPGTSPILTDDGPIMPMGDSPNLRAPILTDDGPIYPTKDLNPGEAPILEDVEKPEEEEDTSVDGHC